MNVFTVVTPEELLLAPSPRRRLCPYCFERDKRDAWHDLDDSWCCTKCGKKVVVHSQLEPCSDCGRPVRVRYFANRKMAGCTCDLSPEEQEAIALAEVEQERQRAIAQQRAIEDELAAVRRQREREGLQRKADRCWEGKGRKCSVKATAPRHPFCVECLHLKPRASPPPPSHLEDSQYQLSEYD